MPPDRALDPTSTSNALVGSTIVLMNTCIATLEMETCTECVWSTARRHAPRSSVKAFLHWTSPGAAPWLPIYATTANSATMLNFERPGGRPGCAARCSLRRVRATAAYLSGNAYADKPLWPGYVTRVPGSPGRFATPRGAGAGRGGGALGRRAISGL